MDKKSYLLLLLLFVYGSSLAQGRLLKKIIRCKTISGSVIDILQSIESCSGIVIEYSPYYLNANKLVSIEATEGSLGRLLEMILVGQKVKVRESNDKIILVPAELPLESGTLVEHFNLSGFVLEEGSLEPLPFSVVKEKSTGYSCQANLHGYYNLTLPEGKHWLEISYVGHAAKFVETYIASSTKLNVTLQPGFLPEVKVEAGNMLQRDGGSKLDKRQSETYNNILGETDPVRSLYLQPGNIETQETTGKLVVRGGDPDQSLFLLDGNRVFNPSHLLGEISIINSTLAKTVRQFKNDFPTRFGGALSSVTEVNTKDGNMDKWTGEATAGFLAGALTLEGPISKGRTALMVSFRHSWSTPVLNGLDDKYRIRFYDLHFKITHLLNANNKLMASGYIGNDRLDLQQYNYQNLQRWGNRLATVNWNHAFGRGTFVNTTFNVSNYSNLAGMKFSIYDDTTGEIRKSAAFNNTSSIQQYEIKTQFELTPLQQFQFRVGGKFLQTDIQPYRSTISREFMEEIDYFRPMKPLSFSELVVNAEAEFKPTHNFLIRPGAYLTAYRFGNYYYNAFQPRLFAALRLTASQQLSFSYSRMGQFLHQVTSPFLGINSEMWVPSTSIVRPAESNMLNVGYTLKGKKDFGFSADLYYKKINNVTNFAERGNIFYDENTWEQDLISGKGSSYGTELFIRKKYHCWSFQTSYTLSWNWRQFPAINEGRKYPFRYDRRHNLNVAIHYAPLQCLDMNLVWYYSSGDMLLLPKTFPTNFDQPSPTNPSNQEPSAGNQFVYDDTSFNLHRAPSYHRLNFNANYYFGKQNRLQHKVAVGVYNAYHASSKYLPDIWNTENGTYNTTLSSNRIFHFTIYLSYTVSF